MAEHRLMVIVLALLALSAPSALAFDLVPPPWEVWRDLAGLAVLEEGDRAIMSSSYCPLGTGADRHSAETPRFIRVVGDEGVIFEDTGAGAITRIWMTMGWVVSKPLDPAVGIRITIDGADHPVVDMPLPDLFAGTVAPFLEPLVGNREVSSGGNYCYVPIAYRRGCRVSLVGAADATIWYQVTARKVADPERVTPFAPGLDLSAYRRLLAVPGGSDPWPDERYAIVSGEACVKGRKWLRLAQLRGPDIINGVLLRAPRNRWRDLVVALGFDGRRRVEITLAEFFAVGGAGAGDGVTSSLLVGATGDGDLYCYFPMPFVDSATVDIGLVRGVRGPVDVGFAVRRAGRPPHPSSGRFGATVATVPRSRNGRDTPILALGGPGRWVGLFAEIGSLAGKKRLYLEGDERVYIDGARTPTLHGTGVEDFFGGGFYFRLADNRPVPFRLATHGMSYDRAPAAGGTAVGMYRLMMADAVPFDRRLRVHQESGRSNDIRMRLHTVAYHYVDPATRAPRTRRRVEAASGGCHAICDLDHDADCDAADLAVFLDHPSRANPTTRKQRKAIGRELGAVLDGVFRRDGS